MHAGWWVGALAADTTHNATGLPTYPGDMGGLMDSTVRSIPSGQHCTHYSSNVPDALAQVEAWYRKALPDAKPDDINHQSLDDSFKLDG